MKTSSDIVTANDQRRALRAQLLAARHQLTLAKKSALDDALCVKVFNYLMRTLPHAQSVDHPSIALYWPIRDEPDLMPLAHQCLDKAWTVLLPIVAEKNAPLQFGRYTADTTLHTGAYNIPEPDLTEMVNQAPDAVIIPCVGFTQDNYRLGYGGGYYDRTLAAWREAGSTVLTVGVAYANALVDFEKGTFDVPLDIIFSE